MSDEEKDLRSVEQTREEIESLLGATVSQLGEIVKQGGKSQSKRVKCPHCMREQFIEVKVADADLLVKAVSALSSAAPRLASKEDQSSVKATKLLTDLSALSNAELAEYAVRLEEEILAAQAEK